jgi:alanine dehydrogenase
MPRMLVLSRSDVVPLLQPDALRRAVAGAMADLSAGRVSMPNRVAALVAEHDGFLGAMPAYLPSSNALTTKLVSLFPRNRDRPTHQAVVVAFDPENGTPVALLDATQITAARTAAGSALSAELLAREDARVLAILGTGVQARTHVKAVARVRSFERVLVAGRNRSKAEAVVAEVSDEISPPIEAVDTFEEAVRAADVVSSATHADEPVVRWEWLRPGTHVTSVGFNSDGLGEVDAETVVHAALFVESRESALAPPPTGAVELIRAIADGLIDASRVRAEIGELVSGTAPGRSNDDEVTLYKSVGVAVQDAAAAAIVLEAARASGAGTEVEI